MTQNTTKRSCTRTGRASEAAMSTQNIALTPRKYNFRSSVPQGLSLDFDKFC